MTLQFYFDFSKIHRRFVLVPIKITPSTTTLSFYSDSTNLEQIGSEKPLQTSFTVKNDYLYSLQSGAKINISDGSCPERIVTVTGHTDSIYKAFKLICNKFEEVSLTQNKNPPLRKATSDLRSRGEIGHKLVLASLLLSPL